MDIGQLMQNAEQQKNKAVRVGSSHRADDLKQKNRDLYSVDSIDQDMAQISQILSEADLILEDEDRARLQAIQGRNMSTLLLMQEKTVGDSKEMKAVKKAISKIEVQLACERSEAFTVDMVDYLLGMYDEAIIACRHYTAEKDPSYGPGKARMQQVRMNTVRLLEEAADFRVAQQLMRAGKLNGRSGSLLNLLRQAKTYALKDNREAPAGDAPVCELPTEEEVSAMGFEVGILYQAFSGRETPSDLIARLSKSKDKKEKEFAAKLPSVFNNIRIELEDFKENKACAFVCAVGGSIIHFAQDEYGQLSVSVGINTIHLERHSAVLGDMLASDIVRNDKIYGRNCSRKVISDIVNAYNISSDKRQILTDYLTHNTKYRSDQFANFSTSELASIIREIHKGKKFYIVDSKDTIDGWVGMSNDLIYEERGNRLINVAETGELLKDVKKDAEKVKEKVILKKKDAPGEAQEAKEEKKEEKLAEWTKEDDKIKNLLADIIFSYETWIDDEHAKEPGKRLKLMLQKNADALAVLISDLINSNEKKTRTLVEEFVYKLPMFTLDPKDQFELIDSLTDVLDDTLDLIMNKVAQIAGDKVKEVKKERERLQAMGEDMTWAETFRFMSLNSVDTEDKVKGFILAHLKNPVTLLGGNALLNIPSLAQLIDETVKPEDLKNIEKNIDDGINEATKDIQDTVSKYSNDLFKPEKKAPKPLPDPNAPGLEPEEVKNRKRERIKLGNERLNQMLKDSMTAGTSGQGLFTKLVFEKYFAGVDVKDKRCMIASMIRNSKPVPKFMDTADPKINPIEPGIEPAEQERRTAELQRRKEYNKKIEKEVMANYIGGLLKGAGPLFQKMMQGLPMEGLPDEIKGAIKDMKSKLAPIPDEIVEAELNNMVRRSHKQIKSIKVIKSLGAASVGQTFLCKMVMANGKEEEVAIKLLKPDVRNRMQREKKLMIECSRQTDIEGRRKDNEKRAEAGQPQLPEFKKNEKGGMQVTYEGQLQRIEEELDLTIEARNVELGKVYDEAKKDKEKKVESMKLNNIIQPTANSMVLKKAQGETLDSLLERIRTETEKLKELYRKDTEAVLKSNLPEARKRKFLEDAEDEPYFSMAQQAINQEDPNAEKGSETWKKYDPNLICEKLASYLSELKKKKEFLNTYAYKWTKEGVFNAGFYHGDPHDGNIMISDEGLTVIDFGNCTKLNADQQLHITRMLTAASIGDVDMFRHGFHMLLDPKFESLYQEKRSILTEEFRTVFALGNKRGAGSRIAVALLKAQALGLEVPSSVYNFSQGQIRLQNAIDNMNHQIEATKEVMRFYLQIPNGDSSIDMTNERKQQELMNREGPVERRLYDIYHSELMIFTDNRDDIKEILRTEPNAIKAAYIVGIRGQLSRAREAVERFRNVAEETRNLNPEVKATGDWKERLTNALSGTGNIYSMDLRDEMRECLGADQVDEARIEVLAQRMQEACTNVENTVKNFDDMIRKQNKIKSRHKDRFEPTAKEMTEYETLENRFLDGFMTIHNEQILTNNKYERYFKRQFEMKTDEDLRGEVDFFFEMHPEGREEFMTAYEAFMASRKANERETAPDVFRTKRNALRNIYLHLISNSLRNKMKAYEDTDVNHDTGFLEVMSDVIDEEMPKMQDRLGIYTGLKVDRKMKAIKKAEKAIGLE